MTEHVEPVEETKTPANAGGAATSCIHPDPELTDTDSYLCPDCGMVGMVQATYHKKSGDLRKWVRTWKMPV